MRWRRCSLLPPINWKRTDAARLQPALLAGLETFLLALLLWFVLDPASLTVAGAVAMAAWIVLSHGYDVFQRRKALSRAYVGMSLAHLGFAVCIWHHDHSTQSIERDVRMVPQDQVELDDMIVTF